MYSLEGLSELSWKVAAILRRRINKLLQGCGYSLERAKPMDALFDMRSITEDPIESLYLSKGKPILLDIPLDRLRCLGNLAFPCIRGMGHPLVETAVAYLQGRCGNYAGSPLECFSRAWTPSNAAEAIGLSETEASHGLVNLPAYASVNLMPWGSVDPSEAVSRRAMFSSIEYKRLGADLTVEEGTLFGGHISIAMGELEFSRITQIVDSIRTRGYLRSSNGDGDIKGLVLIRGHDWVIHVIQAQHRVAALAALEASRAPLQICDTWWQKTNAVRRAEVDSWPNVRNGLFTRKQALKVFDRIFEGRQPAGYVGTGLLAEACEASEGWLGD